MLCTWKPSNEGGVGVRDRHRVHLRSHLFSSYHLAWLWRGRMIHTNTAQCDGNRLLRHGRSGLFLYMSLHWRPWSSRRPNRVRCDLICCVWQPHGQMSKLKLPRTIKGSTGSKLFLQPQPQVRLRHLDVVPFLSYVFSSSRLRCGRMQWRETPKEGVFQISLCCSGSCVSVPSGF